jgi:membrane protein
MQKFLREKIGDAGLILKESFFSFQRNNNFGKSAAFAYYGFFAFIPLILLVIYILGNYILSSQAAVRAVEGFTAQMFPEAGKVITKEITSLSRHKKLWGGLSIITLFWSITPLAGALRDAFLRIFKEEDKASFLKAKLLNAMAVLVLLVLFITLVLSELFYSMVVKGLFRTSLLLDIVTPTVSLILILLFMCVFYYTFSPVRVKYSHLLAGALVTAVLLAIIKPVFSLFLSFNPNYGVTFGSLKAIFIIFVWVYYSFAVILLGGEVIANTRKKDALLLKRLFSRKSLPKSTLDTIAGRFTREYGEGDTVFHNGEPGDTMYYVLTGAVTMVKNGQTLKVMRHGEYFGEMSMLLDAPRTATAVVAEHGTHLAVISRDNFEVILREEPGVVISILKEMALRLKTTDENVG